MNSQNEQQDWYFTFGSGHAFPNCYMKLHGTFTDTRATMFKWFGDKWAFQYDADKALDVIARFRMKEVEVDKMTEAEFHQQLAEQYMGIAEQDGLETAEETIREQLPKSRADQVWLIVLKEVS